MAADVHFVKRNLGAEEVISALQGWDFSFGKAIGRAKASSQAVKNLLTAQCVAKQSIESIAESTHGHI